MAGTATKNFSYSEFTKQGKPGAGVPDSVLSEQDRYKVHQLCKAILQPIRDQYGQVSINSGKRSAVHNANVGGSPASHHLYNGMSCAVDFTVLGFADDVQGRADVALFILQRCPFAFSELIWYTTTNHFHMALPTERHGQKVLVKTNRPSPEKYVALEFDPANATASARRVVAQMLKLDAELRG